MTTIAEKIVVMTPCYNIFFNSIVNNGRNVLESRLHYEDGVYSIDQEDLEEKLADPQTSMLILCNPHNPVGKIWDRETLERIGELCFKHHVLVLSDEIHCILRDPGWSISHLRRYRSIVKITASPVWHPRRPLTWRGSRRQQ